MADLDRFESRLRASIHAFADGAPTEVDAIEVAERTIARGRGGLLAFLWHPLPVPVSTLVALGLLLAVLAWSALVGAPRDDRRSFIPPAIATPTPASAAPTRTPLASTDAQGAEHVVGVELAYQIGDYTETVVGAVTQLRDATFEIELRMNDARVTGTGTWGLSADAQDNALGPQWGHYRLENDAGAWEGACSGGMWLEGEGMAGSCWLVGSGAYAGSTFYLHHSKAPSEAILHVKGVIYPGPPPVP